MPVEIREIVIRTNVSDSQAPALEGMPSSDSLAALKAEIVAECIRETLSILKKKEER
jgi:hypothetical protein